MKKSQIRAFLAVLSASILLISCCTTKPIGGHHTENNTAISASQSKERDSIHIERWNTIYLKGDTVYVEKTKTVYKDRVKTKTDTLFLEKQVSDTIYVEVEKPIEIPVEKVVEKKVVPNWCVWLVTINVILVLVGIYKIRKKIKNKII